MAEQVYSYDPDYALKPGETLEETIEAIGMSQAELSRRAGRPVKTINGIIRGKVAITSETAIQLERVLGVPAGFWTNLERNYQDIKARIEERKRLKEQVGLLDLVPYKELEKRELIKKFRNQLEKVEAILDYFAVASRKEWKQQWGNLTVAFRQSPTFRSNHGAVAAWLRQGQLEAQEISCAYDQRQFKKALKKIRSLTTAPPEDFEPKMTTLCASVGVAVVIIREFPKTSISGATHWFYDKPVIQLSLRYKSNDHFWFTFFHEAGHILLHGKKDVFLEGKGMKENNKEKAADHFSSNFLIPPSSYSDLINSGSYNDGLYLTKFAAKIGIAPGIIVGRLQYEKEIPYKTTLNYLKRKFVWNDD